MAQAGNIAQYVTIGLSRQTEAYSYWYEGEQAKQYFRVKQDLTRREKVQAQRNIEMQRMNAATVSGQAADAQKEADYTRQIGKIKEENYQDETDAGLSSAYANMANSGVDMSYGSPMEYMNAAIDKRAKGLGLLQWQNDYDYWRAESRVAAIKDKATIMLDEAKIAEANLPMYDFQVQLYEQARDEAAKASMLKQGQAYLGAVSDFFTVFNGGGGSSMNMGSSGGGMDTSNMGSFDAGSAASMA